MERGSALGTAFRHSRGLGRKAGGNAGRRDGIIPPGRPRVATEQTPCGQADPAHDAVREDSLDGIRGTGGRKPAGRRQKRRNRPLVQTRGKHGQPAKKRGAHARAPGEAAAATPRRSSTTGSKSRWTKAKVTRSGLSCRLGTTTISIPGGKSAWWSRKNSLSTRLTRFRRTADPIFLETAKPTRHSTRLGA